jgi:Lrp/AsnC family transcriptional regulator for asnA, asnC and gidA
VRATSPAGPLGGCNERFGCVLRRSPRILPGQRADTFDLVRGRCQDRAVTRSNGRGERSRPALDDVSKAIIEQLQQDGRRSYASIGKVVGLSEAAVRQRVQRLIDHGVMQVVAVTDPLELGFSRQAMIGIRATGDLEPVADALVAMDEVDYVVVAAGSFDMLVEVVAESDEHLLEIVSKRIRAIPQVLSTETFVYLKLRKQTYAWGVR